MLTEGPLCTWPCSEYLPPWSLQSADVVSFTEPGEMWEGWEIVLLVWYRYGGDPGGGFQSSTFSHVLCYTFKSISHTLLMKCLQ